MFRAIINSFHSQQFLWTLNSQQHMKKFISIRHKSKLRKSRTIDFPSILKQTLETTCSSTRLDEIKRENISRVEGHKALLEMCLKCERERLNTGQDDSKRTADIARMEAQQAVLERRLEKLSSIISQDDIKQRNIAKMEAEKVANNACKLDDGTPIFLIDNKLALNALSEYLNKFTENAKNKEEVISIGAKWGPKDKSAESEKLTIIQIATSQAIFIVDYQRLISLCVPAERPITSDELVYFFESLFWNRRTKKIGYGFGNDIRVLKKTFPFLFDILRKDHTNITLFCLHTLLRQIALIPDASEIIFGPNPPKTMKLANVVDHFLNIQLAKEQKKKEWFTRPLTIEQKKCAAMEVYSMKKVYDKVFPNVWRLRPVLFLPLIMSARVKIIRPAGGIAINAKNMVNYIKYCERLKNEN